MELADAATKRKRSYDRGFTEPFFLTSSEPDLKSRRPILTPEKFIYCTKSIEGAMHPDEFREFNKIMFNHYYNVLLDGSDEVNVDVKQMCEEGMAKHAP